MTPHREIYKCHGKKNSWHFFVIIINNSKKERDYGTSQDTFGRQGDTKTMV
jgi:hypothetical protein